MASTLRTERPTAFSENVDADVIFILSGAHVGFLPDHIAAPWIGIRKDAPTPREQAESSGRFSARHGEDGEDSEALDAFRQVLARAFNAHTDSANRHR